MEWSCLKGTRVLELARLLPGPYCCLCLADFGADVVKIEEPPHGDYVRLFGQETYDWLNRDKRSIALDLRLPQDRETFLKLVADADAVVEGFRPGVLAKLGLDFDTLRAHNPRLVLCSITGFGQDGPHAKRAGHDLVYLAEGGYWATPSQLRDSVTRPHIRLSDVTASLYAALSVAVAVMSARASGHGQHVDVSITDSVLAWTLPKIAVAPEGETVEDMLHVMPDNDIFETADGQHLVIGVLEDKFWKALAAVLVADDPALAAADYLVRAGRLQDKRRLNSRLVTVFRNHTLDEWRKRLQGTDVPWSPVFGAGEIRDSAQARARQLVLQGDDNGREFPVFPFPVKFSAGMRTHFRAAPAAMGCDSESVLGALREADFAAK